MPSTTLLKYQRIPREGGTLHMHRFLFTWISLILFHHPYIFTIRIVFGSGLYIMSMSPLDTYVVMSMDTLSRTVWWIPRNCLKKILPRQSQLMWENILKEEEILAHMAPHILTKSLDMKICLSLSPLRRSF